MKRPGDAVCVFLVMDFLQQGQSDEIFEPRRGSGLDLPDVEIVLIE